MRKWLYKPWDWWRAAYRRCAIIVRWLPIIWRDNDWDYLYILRVLEHKLRRHAAYEKNHGHHMGNLRNAREMRVAAELCRRMCHSDYIFVIGRDPQDWEIAKPFGESGYQARLKERKEADDRDLEYLTRLLNKKLRTWWD